MIDIAQLHNALPQLDNALAQSPELVSVDTLWERLQRLLIYPAPSGGVLLPGAVIDAVQDIAREYNLTERFIVNFENTGNMAIRFGVEREKADIILSAHLDRPAFRVKSLADNSLYAISAYRFPEGEYRAPAKSFRYENGTLIVGSEGELVAIQDENGKSLSFHVTDGELAPADTITLASVPKRDGDTVVASGLDNALGVATLLAISNIMQQLEPALIEQDKTVLLIFTDNEEAPPDGFFGNGAARLRFAVPAPRRGIINVDGQNTGEPTAPVIGEGASHAFVAGNGRGAIVPMNYQSLAIDLAASLNETDAAKIQMHYGYQSRSDDMVYSRWTRVLGLTGVPLRHAHTAEETISLSDLQNAIRWTTYFNVACLGIVPGLDAQYVLSR